MESGSFIHKADEKRKTGTTCIKIESTHGSQKHSPAYPINWEWNVCTPTYLRRFIAFSLTIAGSLFPILAVLILYFVKNC